MIQQQQTMILSPYMDIYDLVVPKENILRKINDLIDFSFIYDAYILACAIPGSIAGAFYLYGIYFLDTNKYKVRTSVLTVGALFFIHIIFTQRSWNVNRYSTNMVTIHTTRI